LVPPSRCAGRRWATPLAAAAVVLTGVAAVVLGNRPDASGTTVASSAVAPAAAAPAPAPASTVLRIESTPAGADVALDGRALGETTPAPVTVSGAGPFTLRLSKRGYVSQEVTLSQADLAKGTLSYTLEAAEVPRLGVSITSAYPVEVLSGTQTLSGAATSHQLTVPSGTRIRVVARDLMLDTAINVAGKPVQFTTPATGRLSVLTKFELCKVKVGERLLGFPPITNLPVVAGQYRVDIVCEAGTNPPGQFVTVVPNQTATVRVF
jgi:hypothetical protein